MAQAAIGYRPVMATSLRAVLAVAGGFAIGLLLAAAIVTVLATQFFGFKVLTVSSESMVPALAKGDVVVTRPVAPKDIKERDIVLYRANSDVTVIHRVVGINRIILNLTDSKTGQTDTTTTYQYVMRGDANAAADAIPVDQRTVAGRLWFEVPGIAGILAGRPLQWVFLVVAGGLAAAWALWEIRHVRKLKRAAALQSR